MTTPTIPALAALALLTAACAGSQPQDPDASSNQTLPSTEELVVKTMVCMGETDPFGAPGERLRMFWSPASGAYRAGLEAEIACVGAATTCDAVRACLGWELDPSCEWGCDGSVLVSCHDTPLGKMAERQDCADHPFGRTLCEDGVSVSRCAAPACTGDTFTCEGDVLKGCDHGETVTLDCAQLGGACGTNTAGEAMCEFEGQQCDGDDAFCAGGKTVLCDPRKTPPSVYDCDESLLGPGTMCSEHTGPGLSAIGCGVDQAFGPDACEPSCSGDVLTACLGSLSVQVDCSLMPGATCGAGGDGVATCMVTP